MVGQTGARGKITVRTRRDGEHVMISVGDTGTGIPKEIFQLWSDYLKPRGYRIRYQVIDFPGGVPGDISITIGWDD